MFYRSRNAASHPSRPGAVGSLARFWSQSYAGDYVALGTLIAGWIPIQFFMRPFHRLFSLDNRAIQYPFTQVERVPVVWSLIYSGVIPLLILILWTASFRSKAHKTHVTILGFVVALALSTSLTGIIKNAVGRPRPDLIARCRPAKGTSDYELVTFTVCTQINERILDEGWRSFPSGHSSFAFSGLGYLALFFAGQMHVWRPRTNLAPCLLVLAPLLGAVIIAISRCEDYRHDIYDVTCGALLGIMMAYFSYRCYYPSLRSLECDTPYEKLGGPSTDAFSKLPNDEEQQAQEGYPRSGHQESPEESFLLSEQSLTYNQ